MTMMIAHFKPSSDIFICQAFFISMSLTKVIKEKQ